MPQADDGRLARGMYSGHARLTGSYGRPGG